MNYPITIAGGITLLAFFAHTFGGIREALSTSLSKLIGKEQMPNFEKIDRNWVQSLCAFQMVTVDLLVLSVLLFILSFTNLIIQKQFIAFLLAGYYFLWGTLWLLQLIVLKRKPKDFLLLSQWLFWFICAGLIFWGAQL